MHTVYAQYHVASLNFAIVEFDLNPVGKVLYVLDSDSCLDE